MSKPCACGILTNDPKGVCAWCQIQNRRMEDEAMQKKTTRPVAKTEGKKRCACGAEYTPRKYQRRCDKCSSAKAPAVVLPKATARVSPRTMKRFMEKTQNVPLLEIRIIVLGPKGTKVTAGV